LIAVEAHYKVKPIYTGERYYTIFLKEEFSDYLLIANYNFYRENMQEEWLFWQFTEKHLRNKRQCRCESYNGDLQQLKFITVE
jgi:lysozyme